MLQKRLGNQVTLLILKISCFHLARSEWKCRKIFHLTGLMDLSFNIYIFPAVSSLCKPETKKSTLFRKVIIWFITLVYSNR